MKGITWGLLGSIILALILCSTCLYSDRYVFLKDKHLYQSVVENIKAGKIIENEQGIAHLPQTVATASLLGEVYVSRMPTNNLFVVFIISAGKGSNMSGFLYTEKLLDNTNVEKDYYGERVVNVRNTQYVLRRQINPNWYAISFGLD